MIGAPSAGTFSVCGCEIFSAGGGLLFAAAAGEPNCERPAQLIGQPDSRAPGVFAEFRSDVRVPAAVAAALAKKHGFRISEQYPWGAIYIRDAPAALIDALRCEPEIKSLSYNAVTSVS